MSLVNIMPMLFKGIRQKLFEESSQSTEEDVHSYQDNTKIVQDTFTILNIKTLPYPSYIPVIARCHFWLFLTPQDLLRSARVTRRTHHRYNQVVEHDVTRRARARVLWEKINDKCTEHVGGYFEKHFKSA